MLEGLYEADWASVSNAFVSSNEIPDAINQLTSPRMGECWEALEYLYEELCHQQSLVYPATPLAIPFLIELACLPQIVCRPQILDLINDIAGAVIYSVYRSPTVVPAQDSEEFHDELRYQEIEEQTRIALW